MSDSFARTLSDRTVRAARRQDSPYKLADGGGLFLLVQPNGKKLWRYKYRIAGKELLLAIGNFPDISLAEARSAHTEARKLVAAGVDPVAKRKHDREQIEIERQRLAASSFLQVAEIWTDLTGKHIAASTQTQRKRELKKHVMPKLGNKPVEAITRADLHGLLRSISAHTPEVARNVRGYLYSIFEYAIDAGLVNGNPVPTTRVLARRTPTPHHALSTQRLGSFLRTVDRSNINLQTKIALKLILLTASRKAEIVNGRWSEVDLEKAEWIIPGERMKARRDHWMPLSRQAVDLLQQLRAIGHSGDLMFPHRSTPSKPMANRTLNAVLERLGLSTETKVHGLRALFSTHFNQAGAAPDVIERVLAHVPSDKVRAAYNRYEYRAERRQFLQEWADFVDQCSVDQMADMCA